MITIRSTKPNYEQIEIDIKTLDGIERNRLDFLQSCHEILTQHTVLISTYIGEVRGIKDISQTKKGRQALGVEDQDYIYLNTDLYKAEAYLKLIEKLVIIVQQKVKIIPEN